MVGYDSMKTEDINELQRLHNAERDSWEEYDKLRGPADAAYKKWQVASKARKEEEMYQKARRQVMRELINAATLDKRK